MATKKSTPPLADEAVRPDVTAATRARVDASILATRPDAPAGELPSVDDQLLQAINILKVCAAHTDDDGEEFDLSYPLWAAVSLLEDASRDDGEIIKASTIVKAVAVTLENTDGDIGTGGFEPSWGLDVAIDLVAEVIHERAKENGKKRRVRPKKAMREISTMDPDHARQFHRLLAAAGKLPVAELERLARYAEIELTDRKPRRLAQPNLGQAQVRVPDHGGQ